MGGLGFVMLSKSGWDSHRQLASTWAEISVSAKEWGAAQAWKNRRGERGDQKLSVKFPSLLHRVPLNSHAHTKLENNAALLKLLY